jgi:hypothetical protein
MIEAMDTAPLDGRVIRLHMPDGMSFLAKPVDGLIGEDGEDCWTWGTAGEDEPCPEDWHDGLYWSSNEDGVPSAYPVGWSAAPQPQEPTDG